MKPRVSSENLIRTFSCQSCLAVLLHLRAEIQHRRLHIRHTRQTPCIHSFVKIFRQLFIAALQIAMLTAAICYHLLHPRPVLTRLKCICLKILPVSLKIKGKCLKPFPLFPQSIRTDCRHKAAVHSAGEKCRDRLFTLHLPFNRILQEPRCFFYCFFPGIFMWLTFYIPVTMIF